MSRPDPRLTLGRADLAAAWLEGRLAAQRYQATRALQVVVPSTSLNDGPGAGAERKDELLRGELFDALEAHGDDLWGQARRDGYVGFVRAADLAPAGAPPTHRVSALRTYAFADPSIRSPATGPFSLNALVRLEAEEGDFGRADDGLWFWRGHLAPIGVFEPDPVAVAERFLGAPYLWGGRSSLGLDCSGLVQQALYAVGRACPRDADQQAALGRRAPANALARGDLVCWPDHIGLMLDEARLLHATAFHMAVAIDPLAAVLHRNGPPATFRRLLPPARPDASRDPGRSLGRS